MGKVMIESLDMMTGDAGWGFS